MGSSKINESHSSILLTGDENARLFKLLGQRCLSLATAVVQLYTSEAPNHQKWNKRFCGVATFVKDNPRRSYFLRIFDLEKGGLIFEQEMYNQFRYKTPRPYFHTFEGEEGQVGLNFADESEAEYFHRTVDTKLTERRLKKERRNALKRQSTLNSSNLGSTNNSSSAHLRNLSQNQNPSSQTQNPNHVIQRPSKQQPPGQQHPPGPSSNPMNQPTMNGVLTLQSAATVNVGSSKFKSIGKKEGKRKLRKEDIGMPTNFQHISHVGWDPNKGFDLENVNPMLKQFFSKAGVSEQELLDKETRDFIYDFIDKHGGIEAALSEVEKREQAAQAAHAQAQAQAQMQQQNWPNEPVPVPAPPPRQSSIGGNNSGPASYPTSTSSRPPPPSKVQASPPTKAPPLPPTTYQQHQTYQDYQTSVVPPSRSTSLAGSAGRAPPPPPSQISTLQGGLKGTAPQPPGYSTGHPPPKPPTSHKTSVAPAPPPPPPPMAAQQQAAPDLVEPSSEIPVPPPMPPPMPEPPVALAAAPIARSQQPHSSLPPVMDARSELMEQIRKGGSLRHVNEEDARKSRPALDTRDEMLDQIRKGGSLRHVNEEDARKSRPALDTRDEMLDQIRTGVTLKKVDLEARNSNEGSNSNDDQPPSGIAGMLQKALKERSAALHLSSSDDEEDEVDDDEWDD